jgi:hypothetical protein
MRSESISHIGVERLVRSLRATAQLLAADIHPCSEVAFVSNIFVFCESVGTCLLVSHCTSGVLRWQRKSEQVKFEYLHFGWRAPSPDKPPGGVVAPGRAVIQFVAVIMLSYCGIHYGNTALLSFT